MPTRWQGFMWGILPFGISILAILVVLIPSKKTVEERSEDPYPADGNLVHARLAHE
jgi:hypothetical protein